VGSGAVCPGKEAVLGKARAEAYTCAIPAAPRRGERRHAVLSFHRPAPAFSKQKTKNVFLLLPGVNKEARTLLGGTLNYQHAQDRS
jgi:hypothetical protein